MKWNGAVILNLDPGEWVICDSAKAWKDRYGVLDNRCFADGVAQDGFTLVSNNCLANPVCQLGTKLIVCAHGNAQRIHNYTPEEFADDLYDRLGLREAGLIAFKACEIGADDFLERFLAQLTTGNRTTQIGWLIGYTTSTATMNGREVTDKDWVILRTLFGTKASDSVRVKVVPGNTPINPPNGASNRYVALTEIVIQ